LFGEATEVVCSRAEDLSRKWWIF